MLHHRGHRGHGGALCGIVAGLVAVLSGTVPAQQAQAPTFRATTRLIVTTVVVKDRDGKPIEGLTAQDFIVTEDTEPQDIAFVEYQRLDDQSPLPPLSALPVVNTATPPPVAAAVPSDVSSLVQAGIAAPPVG